MGNHPGILLAVDDIRINKYLLEARKFLHIINIFPRERDARRGGILPFLTTYSNTHIRDFFFWSVYSLPRGWYLLLMVRFLSAAALWARGLLRRYIVAESSPALCRVDLSANRNANLEARASNRTIIQPSNDSCANYRTRGSWCLPTEPRRSSGWCLGTKRVLFSCLRPCFIGIKLSRGGFTEVALICSSCGGTR